MSKADYNGTKLDGLQKGSANARAVITGTPSHLLCACLLSAPLSHWQQRMAGAKWNSLTSRHASSKLEEGTEIYIEPPEQFETSDTVYRLRKSLYGLKQSSRMWWLHLGSVLENKGNMRQLEYENCIWQRRNPRTGKTVYLGAYVDDLVVTGDDKQGIEEITRLLESEFRVTRLGELKWILGCHLQRDLQTGTSGFSSEAQGSAPTLPIDTTTWRRQDFEVVVPRGTV